MVGSVSGAWVLCSDPPIFPHCILRAPGNGLHGPHLTTEERTEASGEGGNGQSHGCHGRAWASFQDRPGKAVQLEASLYRKVQELQRPGLHVAGTGPTGLAPTGLAPTSRSVAPDPPQTLGCRVCPASGWGPGSLEEYMHAWRTASGLLFSPKWPGSGLWCQTRPPSSILAPSYRLLILGQIAVPGTFPLPPEVCLCVHCFVSLELSHLGHLPVRQL